MAVKNNETDDPYAMIHTEYFVLIDTKKRIRGFYDGTDSEAVDQLLDDIKLLKESTYNWSFTTFTSGNQSNKKCHSQLRTLK